MKTRISDIFRDVGGHLGRDVKISGWVRTLRDNNHFGFIELNDGSFFKSLQVVFNEELENFGEVAKLLTGSALTVEGTLVESQGAKQAVELLAARIFVENAAPEEYPLQKKRHNFETLRTMAHLRPRTNTFSAVFRVRSLASFAIHEFFRNRGFVYVHTPIITSSDAEGGGDVFSVDGKDAEFFGRQAYLANTGQLHAEAFALAFSDVYTFGPTFRAENSNTTRHLSEFWMMEPEFAFADLDDNIKLIEDMIKYVTRYVMDNAPEEMEFFDQFIEKGLIGRLENVLGSDFGRITYTDAIDAMAKSGQKFEYEPKWGADIQTEHERFIAEKLFKKPAFITDYPRDIKSFYMRLNEDGKTVAATDLVVPAIGELVGGSQREERLDVLLESMAHHGLRPEDYWWYLELRRFGGVKHSGFGIGFERFIMFMTGMTNIRDVIPFPRTVKHAEF